MSNYEAAPNDSRYVPFTQQDYCCVPTCIQMILYRHGIPLVPAEELGWHLGLTVPPEDASLFYNVRVADTPPPGGYGTQIYNPAYEPNAAFQKLHIPLRFSQTLAADIQSEEDLFARLRHIEAEDGDALLCYNHGVIRGEYKPFTGHVVVFDRVVDGKVRIVDASWKHPKWRLIDAVLLLDAIRRHGNEKSGGIWHFDPTA